MAESKVKAPLTKTCAKSIQDAIDYWQTNDPTWKLKAIKIGTKTIGGVKGPCLDIVIEKK